VIESNEETVRIGNPATAHFFEIVDGHRHGGIGGDCTIDITDDKISRACIPA
jgi:hypothetical protein